MKNKKRLTFMSLLNTQTIENCAFKIARLNRHYICIHFMFCHNR